MPWRPVTKVSTFVNFMMLMINAHLLKTNNLHSKTKPKLILTNSQM